MVWKKKYAGLVMVRIEREIARTEEWWDVQRTCGLRGTLETAEKTT